jgi:hypothetical protein
MYRFLKVAHLLGLAMFLGSVLGHIVDGLQAGPPGALSFLSARQSIALATQLLTAPGLLLLIVSGFAMSAAARPSPWRKPWILVHAGLGLVITGVTFVCLVPTGQTLLQDAVRLARAPDPGVYARVLALKDLESVAGAVNLALTIVVICVGVWKSQRFPWFRRAEARNRFVSVQPS